MSGGFFRGTSADQDTRFSNKQAKLLKSQKFAAELEHLVDMTKVKMEVMKPWIGRRVTELLGFEDEVLINFIYTLLEAKVVNGKEVQIQLTGFMEKNTGKFMKELWTLLLSAQQTASGVPQPLLDAKAEELLKKEAYDHRIVDNIEKRKEDESKDLQLERSKRMEGVKTTNFDMELGPNRTMQKDIIGRTRNDDYAEDKNGNRERSRSPLSSSSDERLHKSSRGFQSRRRGSGSYSRGLSGDRRSSRSLSTSPVRRRRSRTPSKRRASVSPVRRNSKRISVSPVRRRTYSRRRSFSGSRSQSPRPRRVASYNRRSPSPRKSGRSPSPRRRDRSLSPRKRDRSTSPSKHERPSSPRRYDRSSSPGNRRRSPLPGKNWRHPSSGRHRASPSPSQHPNSPPPSRFHRSPSPARLKGSPSGGQHTTRDRSRRSPSPTWRRKSPSTDRLQGSISAGRHNRSWSGRGGKAGSPVRSGRSPYRERRQVRSPSPSRVYRRSPSSEMDKSYSPSRTTPRFAASRVPRNNSRSPASQSLSSPSPRPSFSPPTRKQEDNYRTSVANKRDSSNQGQLHQGIPSTSPPVDRYSKRSKSPIPRGTKDLSQNRKSSYVDASKAQERFADGGSLTPQRARELTARNSSRETSEAEETKSAKNEYVSRSSKVKITNSNVSDSYKNEKSEKSSKSSSRNQSFPVEEKPPNPSTTNLVLTEEDRYKNSGSMKLDSDDSDKHIRGHNEEKKPKRSHRLEFDSDDESSDSEIEDKKEAKRRKKEEKKLRKQERRRRREEKRLRKDERRAEKQKMKESKCDSSSDDELRDRVESKRSMNKETHDDQKMLEIELRNKALESYKAKKGINH